MAMPTDKPKTINCILVLYPDGSKVWESARDYYTNPAFGTSVIQLKHETPEPVIKKDVTFYPKETVDELFEECKRITFENLKRESPFGRYNHNRSKL